MSNNSLLTVYANKTSNEGRIVGGSPTTIQKSPWMVAIFYYKSSLCGGSIISLSRILSAAHCTYGFVTKYFRIRVGSTKFNKGGRLVRVSKIVNHQSYSKSKLENDISILFLASNLRQSPNIGVIDLGNAILADGTEVQATGWGKTCDDDDSKCGPSSTLRAVNLRIIENSRCSEMYKREEEDQLFKIKNSMMCAGYPSGGKDTCTGDSGGPMTFNNTLVGVVSFGIGCARPKAPGVYTRVAFYRKWINGYL